MGERHQIARRTDLRAAGMSYHVQRRLLAAGTWSLPLAGIVASGPVDPCEIAAAAVLLGGREAALGAATAAQVWLGRELTAPVRVLVPMGVTVTSGPLARFRQTRIPFEVVRRDGLPVTRPDRAAADIAAGDLPESDRRALVTALVQRELTTPDAIAHAAARTPKAVRAQVVRLVEELIAGAMSGPEAKFWRDIVVSRRLPVPLLNHPVPRLPYCLDGYFPQLRAGYEVQSREHHADTWLADTRRMAAILVELGIVPLPIPVADIEHDVAGALDRLDRFLTGRAADLGVPLPPFVAPPRWHP